MADWPEQRKASEYELRKGGRPGVKGRREEQKYKSTERMIDLALAALIHGPRKMYPFGQVAH